MRSQRCLSRSKLILFELAPQLNDPDDEMILEAAINGRADALVTYNAAHFHASAATMIKATYPLKLPHLSCQPRSRLLQHALPRKTAYHSTNGLRPRWHKKSASWRQRLLSFNAGRTRRRQMI